MADSYRPDNHPRGRADDYDHTERSRQYRDLDTAHRNERPIRSRSPPRGLDYDDAPPDSDRDWGDGRYSRDGGYDQEDGYGTRKYRPRTPPRRPAADDRRPRYYDRDDYRDYGYDEYVPRPPNQGEKDGAKDDSPNFMVLIRGLKESITEEVFAKGMEKLYSGFDRNSSGATPKSIRRVLLIRDRRTDQNMGYGFVQYYSVDDAKAAVAKARKMERSGERITISSKEINISYAHLGVFPHFDFGHVERDTRFLFQGPQKMHKYNDDRYYPKELIVNEKSPHEPEPQAKEASDVEKKTKKASKETLENKSKKRKAPGAVPAYLDYYQKKQAELREDEQNAVLEESKYPKQPATGVNAISTAETVMSEDTAETTTQEQQTFAHESNSLTACYLCNSQFNTRDGIIRHIKESAMHAKYLQDSDCIDRAHKRMKNKGIDPESTIRLPADAKPTEPAQGTIQPQYRDRAAERRQEEALAGGVQKVGFSLKGKGSKTATGASTSRNSDSETEKVAAKPSYGKGMGMLQKAGWTAGQGLGAEGSEGIAAPIETNVYAAGVGLGHEGSKRGDAAAEAERATKGNGFLEMTKETARKRFEGMM